MGSETSTWSNIKKRLDRIKGCHYQRYEDSLSNGIPDVMICYLGFVLFVELKQLDAFPAKAKTPVRLKFRRDQYNWLYFHKKAGGLGYLVFQIGREYFCVDDVRYMNELCNETWTQQDIRDHCISYKNAGELITNLVERYE